MKKTASLKISISGVRGVIGDSLTPQLLASFAQSFGTYMAGGTVVVGRDTRTSGEMVQYAVFAGLEATGCKVIRLDVAPVPTIQMAVRTLGAAGGIAITASHNPAQWNALKFIRADGCFLTPYEARELLDIYHQGDYAKTSGRNFRTPKKYTRAVDDHIEHILRTIGPLPNKKKKIRAVVDCVNGAGSVMSELLLNALGAEAVAINNTPDGIFPRPPEPLPANLEMLGKAVVEHGADIGFAQDADADRLAIVDEKGRPLGEDYTLVIAVDSALSKKPGPVVVNLATSIAVDAAAARHKCPVFKSKIGEVNVTELMTEKGAVIGGEGNGGVIFPETNFARDSFAGMALTLRHLAGCGMTTSALAASYPKYFMTKTTLPCPALKARDALEGIIKNHSSEKLDLTEGVKIVSGKSWALVRTSNTEPIIRIISEASSEAKSQQMNKELTEEVKRLID